MKNTKIVYILAAGFSKDAGGLLMKEFLLQKELGHKRKELSQVYSNLKGYTPG
jgi:hypothetical protein